jgi:PEP-CTERM motif
MNKKLALGITLCLGLTSQTWAAPFVNGGFEDGTFNGWSQDGGFVGTGPVYFPNGSNRNAIVGSGLDALTNNNLNQVYSGNYSARVEDSNNGALYSTVTQKVVNYTDANIFFAWAAVLDDPQHDAIEQPRFSIKLSDDTTSTVLYDVTFDVSNPAPGITLNNGAGSWKYTNWVIQSLDVSARSGHDFTLTVLAADCTLGGHGGYAYVDGFGAVIPPGGDVPEPGMLALLGIGVAGMASLRRKKVNV